MSMTTDFWGDRSAQDSIHAESPVSSKLTKPSSGFGKILETLFVTAAGAQEPKIWQTSDRNGVLIWHIYDPMTKESTSFTTELEVRSWLEQRYYQ